MTEEFKIIKLLDFKEFRISKKEHSYSSKNKCSHREITLDDHGQIVMCALCGIQLSPYWILKDFSNYFGKISDSLEAKKQHLEETINKNIHRIAARKLDDIWRSKDMIPCCPHCGEGILATDGLGQSCINKRIAEARKNKKKGG